jgi:hypothetical protein
MGPLALAAVQLDDAFFDEQSTVEALFARIGKDPQQCRVMVLLRRSIDAPQFAEWSMGPFLRSRCGRRAARAL